MELMIEVKNAVKKFKEYRALDDVSLSFEKGKIHGIIGRNGSGKTVLFKCICGFLKLDAGEILVDGKRIGKDIEAPQDIGVIIDSPGFLPNYSGYQNLHFLACIRNRVHKNEIQEIMKRVGLDPKSRKHVGKYSMGMRQRLGIAQAIMEKPELLILDEPFHGLDKENKQCAKQIIEEFCKRKNKTLIMVTHREEDWPEIITNRLTLKKNT